MIFMNISISENAKRQLMESESKNYRIIVKGYGWAGPVFGLAQGEPQDEEITFPVGDIEFSVEKEIADLVPGFQIDYYKGLFQKGYVVYADGSSRSC